MQKKFLELVKEKAATMPAQIIFPETFDERTLRAVSKIVHEGTAHPILIGNPKKIVEDLKRLGLSDDLSSYKIIDMEADLKRRELYAQKFYEMRREKGATLEVARKLMTDYKYFSVMALKMNEADGLIFGANCPTPESLRPTLQIMKTKEKFHKVSGFFFIAIENRILLFADCMVNIDPNSRELAEIAIDTALTAKCFGIEPRIAMLSFSTNGSAKHPSAEKVREATQMVHYSRPDLICDGEMQVDAALSTAVCKRKFPTTKVCGDANVLIFPNLDAANISYKLVEQLGHAQAIGPILQGLEKPVNDLSRGCSVEDIVHLAAITSVEAHEMEMELNITKEIK